MKSLAMIVMVIGAVVIGGVSLFGPVAMVGPIVLGIMAGTAGFNLVANVFGA